MNRLECPSCGEYQGKSLSDLIRHVQLIHADRSFSVRCTGCGRNKLFKNFYTWRDHMYSHHGESEPQKQRVPGPAEPVLLCPEGTFHQEDLTLDPETSDHRPARRFGSSMCSGYVHPDSARDTAVASKYHGHDTQGSR